MRHDMRAAVGLAVAALAAAVLSSCRADPHDHAHTEGGEHAHGEAEVARGPHGGRLLGDDRFALEVTIFETGVPPELRVYPRAAGAPVDPTTVDLAVTLRRFGDRVETVRFTPRDDYLVGDRVIAEPHSFDVTVEATHAGTTHRWEYASHEGRTEMAPEASAASGITIETAGPATVRTTLRLHGRIVPNADRLAHIVPRYAGVVREARADLGARVARGDVLAVVESNETLRSYELRAPLAGTVIEKDVTPGEFVGHDRVLYAVADLATVWVDLAAYPQDLSRLATGQTVQVTAAHGPAAAGRLVYLAPVGSDRTQTVLARAELDNPDRALWPGLFVSAEVVVEETEVPVAVRTEALQTFRDWDVVFLTDGRVFQAMPVEIGRRDASWAEIRAGVAAGKRYAARGSFVVKADVGKAGATHEH